MALIKPWSLYPRSTARADYRCFRTGEDRIGELPRYRGDPCLGILAGVNWILNVMPGRLLFALLAAASLLPLSVFSPPSKATKTQVALVRYVGEEEVVVMSEAEENASFLSTASIHRGDR